MTRITIEDTFSRELEDVTSAVELCNRSGRVIGRFVPSTEPGSVDPSEPQVSEKELDRRQNSSEWRTTADVLNRLGEG